MWAFHSVFHTDTLDGFFIICFINLIIFNYEAVQNEIFSTSRNLLSIRLKCFSRVFHCLLLDLLLLVVLYVYAYVYVYVYVLYFRY